MLKAAYDHASMELDEANSALSKALQEEQRAASVISEDHIIANELGKKLHDIFPTLRTGYLVRGGRQAGRQGSQRRQHELGYGS